jgi:hypothetical protein
MTDPNTNPTTTAKGRRGCLFYGLIVLSLVFLLVLAGVWVGFYYAKKMLNNFTDTQPRPVPTVEMSHGEYQELQTRIENFRKAVRGGTSTEPLTLTDRELNALINGDPDFQQLKGKVYIDLDGSQVKGQVSLPLDQLLPMFRGRYLNADATLNVSVRNGLLRVSPDQIFVKGRPIPETYMESLRKQNLARDLNSEPRVSAALDRIKEVSVEDGNLVIVPAPPQ